MISKSGVHLPDTTYGGNPIAWKNADDSDEWLRRIRDENAELREFAAEAWELLTCNEPNFVWSGLQEKARELGIEDDE